MHQDAALCERLLQAPAILSRSERPLARVADEFGALPLVRELVVSCRMPDGLLSFRFLSSLLSRFAGRGAPGPRSFSTFPQLTLRLAHQRTFAGRPESVLLRALLATP
jgi:hypothetical protein